MTTTYKRIGFVGTGTISAAIIRGLLRDGRGGWTVTVSPRNAETAETLAREFPFVDVAVSNQDVVDRSDFVILAVRPDAVEAVVRSLAIPSGKVLISLVATLGLDRLQSWTGEGVRLVRALPLPFVADGNGVTMVMPPDDDALALFGACGKSVGCDTVENFELLTTASAMMGSYFGILERLVSWLEREGLPKGDAEVYLRSLFHSLGTAAARSSAPFDQMRNEFSTRGGLNEQIFRDFVEDGGASALERAMSSALSRVRAGRKS